MVRSSPARSTRHRANLLEALPTLARTSADGRDIWLGREHFLVASVRLQDEGSPPVQLLVLKSYDAASLFLRQTESLDIGLGLFVLVAGGLLAVYLARASPARWSRSPPVQLPWAPAILTGSDARQWWRERDW